MRRLDRPELELIGQAVEGAALVHHALDEVCFRAGEDVAHVAMVLDDAPQVPLGGLAPEAVDLLELIQHDPNGRSAFLGEPFDRIERLGE